MYTATEIAEQYAGDIDGFAELIEDLTSIYWEAGGVGFVGLVEHVTYSTDSDGRPQKTVVYEAIGLYAADRAAISCDQDTDIYIDDSMPDDGIERRNLGPAMLVPRPQPSDAREWHDEDRRSA